MSEKYGTEYVEWAVGKSGISRLFYHPTWFTGNIQLYGLESLFYGISNFVVYLMAKSLSKKESCDVIHATARKKSKVKMFLRVLVKDTMT